MPKMASDNVRELQRRRKIPLACEPCRDRKSRCDGGKPICSACHKRGLSLPQCVYKIENARTASTDVYIRVLHDRIRLLEQTCEQHGVAVPPVRSETPQASSGREEGVPHLSAASRPGYAAADHNRINHQQIAVGASGVSPGGGHPGTAGLGSGSGSAPPVDSATIQSMTSPVSPGDQLDGSDIASDITAMGTISTEAGVQAAIEATNEFYGSSSAASFMQEAYSSMKPRSVLDASSSFAGVGGGYGGPMVIDGGQLRAPAPSPGAQFKYVQVERFSLPPRALADHLLSRYWDRSYYLYPFFHRPAFEQTYRRLWQPASELGPVDPFTGLGIGSSPGAGADSIVFQVALNTIFAIGCLFSDLGADDRGAMARVFFLRAKSFVGLDLLDANNIGVAQALLLMALFLQSTAFPHRCWNSVGVACRVAEGLGVHTEQPDRVERSPLETEIRRRTWHGCVILDMLVSMTFGRPTMTTHIPSLPLPSALEFETPGSHHHRPDDPSSTPSSSSSPSLYPQCPSRMTFYVTYIRLCRVLGDILSRVYHQQQARYGNTGPATPATTPPHLHPGQKRCLGLDDILALDAQLADFEDSLGPLLSWKAPAHLSGLPPEQKVTFEAQRNVLHGQFLYLRVMLHRPVLTQLCVAADGTPTGAGSSTAVNGLEWPDRSAASTSNRMLYNSFATESAKVCLRASMELLDLVHATYQTPATGGWWWDGLYACTAGLVLIVAHLSPSLLGALDGALDPGELRQYWRRCQEILDHLASFSTSVQKSQKLLLRIHSDVMAQVASESKPRGPGPVPPAPFSMAGPNMMQAGNPGASGAAAAAATAGVAGAGDPSQVLADFDMLERAFFNWEESVGFTSEGFAFDGTL